MRRPPGSWRRGSGTWFDAIAGLLRRPGGAGGADGASTPAIRGRRRGTENPWQFAGRWKNTDRPAHCASVWGNGSSSSHPWIFSCS